MAPYDMYHLYPDVAKQEKVYLPSGLWEQFDALINIDGRFYMHGINLEISFCYFVNGLLNCFVQAGFFMW